MDGVDDGLRELLDPLGVIRFRRMFGGVGVYCGELMFGLIADGTLYFKADEQTIPAYVAEGCEAFGYTGRTGRRVVMSYWRVPERLVDEPEEFLAWARAAYEAALRKRGPKPRRRASGVLR